MECCPALSSRPVHDAAPAHHRRELQADDARIILMTPVDSSWLSPPANLILSSDEIHIWRASLDQPAWRLQALAQTLSADEQARAGRFRFERDRNRFIASHGILRAILGRYLGAQPRQLQYCYGPHGKPALAETLDRCTLHFNISHSHKLVLYAITRDQEIGVDLEHIRPLLDAEQIAERIFSAQENTVFRALPANARHEAFFTGWTRKEAHIKARGDGLSLRLDQSDVCLTPGEPARLLNTRDNPQEVCCWSLWDLAPGPGYVAAVAVQGQEWQLQCWQWMWPRE